MTTFRNDGVFLSIEDETATQYSQYSQYSQNSTTSSTSKKSKSDHKAPKAVKNVGEIAGGALVAIKNSRKKKTKYVEGEKRYKLKKAFMKLVPFSGNEINPVPSKAVNSYQPSDDASSTYVPMAGLTYGPNSNPNSTVWKGGEYRRPSLADTVVVNSLSDMYGPPPSSLGTSTQRSTLSDPTVRRLSASDSVGMPSLESDTYWPPSMGPTIQRSSVSPSIQRASVSPSLQRSSVSDPLAQSLQQSTAHRETVVRSAQPSLAATYQRAMVGDPGMRATSPIYTTVS